MTPPDPATARALADRFWRAIELEYGELHAVGGYGPRPSLEETAEEVFTQSVHMDLFLWAMARMRRLADWLDGAAWATSELMAARQQFLDATPTAKDLRDTAEHFDEYMAGTGRRQRAGEVPSGWAYVPGKNGVIIYGFHELRLGPAYEAARELHFALAAVVGALSR